MVSRTFNHFQLTTHNIQVLKQEQSHQEDEASEGDSEFDSSDGSITDEDSLIEIQLQVRNIGGLNEDQDLLDMNEEDNMIEIDISMGSIK